MPTRHLQSAWTWEKLEQALLVPEGKEEQFDDGQVEQVERVVGHRLPESYWRYVRHWGCGLAFGLFVVWTPLAESAWNIRVQFPKERDLVRGIVAAGFLTSRLEERLKRLTPFGKSINGDLLCWDPQKALPDGEIPIYLVDSEFLKAPHVGDSLLSFFGDYCADGRLDKVFPVGRGQKWHLPWTFEPYD